MSDTLTRARAEQSEQPAQSETVRTTAQRATPAAPTATPSTLRAQPAGWGVIRRCLELQSAARRRGRIGRVFGADPLHPDAIAWFQAGVGELELGRTLDALGEEWTVLHGVPAGARGREIDHLLIGPAGVIAIDTTHLDARVVVVDGDTITAGAPRAGLVHDVMEEREDAASRLSVALAEPIEVTSLIVAVGAERVVVRPHPAVQVVTPAELGRVLQRAGGVLTRRQVADLVRTAERPETWQPQLPAAVGTATLPDRFDDLRREVMTARHRRDAWSVSGLLVALAASWTAVLTFSPDAVSEVVRALLG